MNEVYLIIYLLFKNSPFWNLSTVEDYSQLNNVNSNDFVDA